MIPPHGGNAQIREHPVLVIVFPSGDWASRILPSRRLPPNNDTASKSRRTPGVPYVLKQPPPHPYICVPPDRYTAVPGFCPRARAVFNRDSLFKAQSHLEGRRGPGRAELPASSQAKRFSSASGMPLCPLPAAVSNRALQANIPVLFDTPYGPKRRTNKHGKGLAASCRYRS